MVISTLAEHTVCPRPHRTIPLMLHRRLEPLKVPMFQFVFVAEFWISRADDMGNILRTVSKRRSCNLFQFDFADVQAKFLCQLINILCRRALPPIIDFRFHKHHSKYLQTFCYKFEHEVFRYAFVSIYFNIS